VVIGDEEDMFSDRARGNVWTDVSLRRTWLLAAPHWSGPPLAFLYRCLFLSSSYISTRLGLVDWLVGLSVAMREMWEMGKCYHRSQDASPSHFLAP